MNISHVEFLILYHANGEYFIRHKVISLFVQNVDDLYNSYIENLKLSIHKT